jgi:hypothetical protein
VRTDRPEVCGAHRGAGVLGLALGFALMGCLSMSAVGVRGGLPAEQVATFAPDVRASYELFTRRCSRCHSLARPLTAPIGDREHWSRYVTRMRRQPSSGISPADAEDILVFLEHWSRLRAADDVVVTTSTDAAGGAP